MMERDESLMEDDFIFYSLLYSAITVLFAMAVLSKFLTNEFRFGFRSFLSLIMLFIGEPLCHFFLKGPSGVALFGVGCLLVYYVLPANHLPASNKAVLITGCDSGFGLAVAKKLDSIGMRVFAGCLYDNSPGAIELQNNCSERLQVLQLDVTSESQIQEALQVISDKTGDNGLWGLVNNAGVSYVAELEMTPDKIFQKTIAVNLMGVVRLTRTLLPLIRLAKGRIVNISSLVGKVPLENIGAYCVSKGGLEAYSDVLRLEMRKWEVKVSVIQPAGYATGALNKNVVHERKEHLWAQLEEMTKATYGRHYYDLMVQNFEESSQRCAKDLTPVVRAIRSALLSKRPRDKYPVGMGAETLLTVFPILPIWLADKLCSVIGSAVKDVNPVALQN